MWGCEVFHFLSSAPRVYRRRRFAMSSLKSCDKLLQGLTVLCRFFQPFFLVWFPVGISSPTSVETIIKIVHYELYSSNILPKGGYNIRGLN